ncbi:MAG: UDP-N-acetylglucosamine 2-epimerase [Candidatus Peribacteraceae bacterium]|nr:UDP-N-acetylglucosamine 2-epimerase [Candidatus Peribacteraceae bacterium]HCI03630.1 UDP-N-acetylglucosamine 2-epimerase (hydrolyzing) [Candidatus Peribacteria bacterium]
MRKVCFIITSQIHYARSKLILEAIREHPNLELQIAVAASAILPQYGDVLSAMEKDGFNADAKIIMTLAGGNPTAMAKTTGIGTTEFATAFDNLKPDIVVIRGDRYEVLAAATAAAYMNITVAHIEGGDVTGTIDESVRHAVTKLSHIHFTTNDAARKRVIKMGENSSYVFNIGCPELEFVKKYSGEITNEELNYFGVGKPVDLGQPFLMIMFHPVTTDTNNRAYTTQLLEAVNSMNMQAIWFWPNVDAGTDDIAKAIRTFREKNDPDHMHFIKYLNAEKFIALLRQATCLIGNSSAGIKECSYLGVPVVNIGTRQNGRTRAGNVTDVPHDAQQIKEAIIRQIDHGKYDSSDIFFNEDCSATITSILAGTDLYIQKQFHDEVLISNPSLISTNV